MQILPSWVGSGGLQCLIQRQKSHLKVVPVRHLLSQRHLEMPQGHATSPGTSGAMQAGDRDTALPSAKSMLVFLETFQPHKCEFCPTGNTSLSQSKTVTSKPLGSLCCHCCSS